MYAFFPLHSKKYAIVLALSFRSSALIPFLRDINLDYFFNMLLTVLEPTSRKGSTEEPVKEQINFFWIRNLIKIDKSKDAASYMERQIRVANDTIKRLIQPHCDGC